MASGRVAHVEVCAVHADEVVLLSRIFPSRAEAVVCAEPGEDFADFPGLGDHRRAVRELISVVHIERSVISLVLPARRYYYPVKTHTASVYLIWQLCRKRVESEVPFAVQADDFR